MVNAVYVVVNYDRWRCHLWLRLIGSTAGTAHSYQLSNAAFVWLVINLAFHVMRLTPPLMWRKLQFLFSFVFCYFFFPGRFYLQESTLDCFPQGSTVSIWSCPVHSPLTPANFMFLLTPPINLLFGRRPGLQSEGSNLSINPVSELTCVYDSKVCCKNTTIWRITFSGFASIYQKAEITAHSYREWMEKIKF